MNDWDENKASSRDPKVISACLTALKSYWPSGKVEEAPDELDRSGADFIAWHPMFESLRYYIDLKYQSRPQEKYPVEWWSKLPQRNRPGIIGWSLGQEQKLTTHLLWFFDGGPVVLMDYAKMVSVVRQNAREWRQKHKVYVQTTKTKTHTWDSEVSFVPPEEFAYAIVHRF
jgi:hypothetical protein